MRLLPHLMIAFLAAILTSSAAGPRFDTASVRPRDPNMGPSIITGGPGTSDPAHFRIPVTDMYDLLNRAFGVQLDQIIGPAWIRDVLSQPKYTLMATMPPDTTKEQFEQMLKNLLIERFHLVFHYETRNFPGYDLVVDNGGPKFKDVTPTGDGKPDTFANAHAALVAPLGADGFPYLPGSRVTGRGGPAHRHEKYQERTMAQFVPSLRIRVCTSQGTNMSDGSPQPRVADKTGLTGTYTFILEYQEATESDGSVPNIFAAIQKQLGLRLDKTTDVPLDVIVVESVDKAPTKS